MGTNSFQMENCILSASDEDWMCGSNQVQAGEYLLGSGSGSPGSGETTSTTSFWDMALTGFMQFWNTMVLENLPPHTTMEYTYVLYNTVKLVLKIAWVMVYSNVNLGHLAAVIFFALGVKAILGLAEFAMFLFKAYNTIFPKIPGAG